MANKITYSSELMKNYQQSEVMSPDEKFQALQTKTSLSLLFSLGSDGVFYVTEEGSQSTATGWQRLDLSSQQIKKDFGEKATCKTFAAAQSVSDGSLGLAMVVNDGTNDHLYLSLNNANENTDWLKAPQWKAIPFDANNKPSTIEIAEVYISEATQKQYILVDIVRDPSSATKLVSRYYINTIDAKKPAWIAHDVAIDLQVGTYQSALGRQQNDYIDGLYTIGKVNNDAQFTYQPLMNVWGSGPASIARLHLPQNVVPESIATARNSDGSTDLYCTAGDQLYYFASQNQKDEATGTALFSNGLLQDTTHLFAEKQGNKVVVWGLNRANEVFYSSCAEDKVAQATAWSLPLPILTGVNLISPYLNLSDEGNVFFAAGNDQLYKMSQSVHTSLWKKGQITLPPSQTTTPAQSFQSYTTRIQLTDEKNQPLSKTQLLISANTRGSFIINNLYTVLTTTPIPIETDNLGSITLIETITDVQGIKLTVAESGGGSVEINPMDKPMQKVSQLNTSDSLTNAKIKNSDGSSTNLVTSNPSSDALKSAASANGQLAKAYHKLTKPQASATKATTTLASAPPNPAKYIWVEAGDLFSWLESGVDHLIDIVEDGISEAWHFVVTIADKVYAFVLDCVEKVASAVKWVFKAIKTAIEDVLKFLAFLFEWEDITRTKKVLENLFKLMLQGQMSQVKEWKTEFNTQMNALIQKIDKWAGIPDMNPLGKIATSPTNSQSTPTKHQSASHNFLSHHFQHNSNQVTAVGNHSPANENNQTNSSAFDALTQVITKEDSILETAKDQLFKILVQSEQLSFGDLIKQLVAVVADTVLESVENIVDALLDLIMELMEGFMEILETPIHIPVVSDILKDFGIDDITILDIFCWIAAIPATLIYKIAKGKAPFPDNATTNKLCTATLATTKPNEAVLSQGEQTLLTSTPSNDAGSFFKLIGLGDLSEGTLEVISIVGHIATSIIWIPAGPILMFDAVTHSNSLFKLKSSLSLVAKILPSGLNFIANEAVEKNPIQNDVVKWLSLIDQALRVLNPLVSRAVKAIAKTNPDKTKSVQSKVDVGLVLLSVICTGWHVKELVENYDEDSDIAATILYEVYNVAFDVFRLGFDFTVFAVIDNDGANAPKSSQMMFWSWLACMGLPIAESIVD